MKKADILTLYDYNYWANDRVLDAAAKVSPAQFVAPASASHGSLRGALVHVFGAEVVWRLRCAQGISPPALPAEDDFPVLDVLVQRWREEEGAMRAYLAVINDEALNQPLRYTTTKGVPYENTLWHLLVHLVNHGTQSRAEAAVVLTEFGHSPGDLDLLLFLRQDK